MNEGIPLRQRSVWEFVLAHETYQAMHVVEGLKAFLHFRRVQLQGAGQHRRVKLVTLYAPASDPLSSNCLLAAAKAGNGEAFGQLAQRYRA